MSDIVIKAENLGKKYIIGHQTGQNGSYMALRDVIIERFNVFWHKTKDVLKGKPIIQGSKQEEFWALKDINFEIKRGETVGIIGRNGAGKSTLLKIMSRITEPSAGRVTIKGRVSSLLEVGTGFHPELTGRENIYLNGSILGMSRAEIKRKFDEIVEFSGVEKFLDTPVKRFSSGMYVRLAFAVAAHLEPEILVIDEVLAVGDAEFQNKCLGKMGEVAGEGRTVLFVSHDMSAIEQICHSCMLLDKGKIEIYNNQVEEVINQYWSPEKLKSQSKWSKKQNNFDSPYFTLQDFFVSDREGYLLQNAIKNTTEVYINFEFLIEITDPSLEIAYELYDDKHRLVFISQHTDTPRETWPTLKNGYNKLITKIPPHFLNEGKYYLKPRVILRGREWVLCPSEHDIMVGFEINGGLSESPYWTIRRNGIVAPVFDWKSIK